MDPYKWSWEGLDPFDDSWCFFIGQTFSKRGRIHSFFLLGKHPLLLRRKMTSCFLLAVKEWILPCSYRTRIDPCLLTNARLDRSYSEMMGINPDKRNWKGMCADSQYLFTGKEPLGSISSILLRTFPFLSVTNESISLEKVKDPVHWLLTCVCFLYWK